MQARLFSCAVQKTDNHATLQHYVWGILTVTLDLSRNLGLELELSSLLEYPIGNAAVS